MNEISRPRKCQKQPNPVRNRIRKNVPKLYFRFHPIIIVRKNLPVCDGRYCPESPPKSELRAR